MKSYILKSLFLLLSSCILANNGFIENKGQLFDQKGKAVGDVLYLYNGEGLNVQLRSNGFSYDSYQTGSNSLEVLTKKGERAKSINYKIHRIDLEFAGANPAPKIIAARAQSSLRHYYGPNLPPTGLRGIRAFQKITYENLYPYIDLEFVLEESGAVKYNFILHPGADPEQISWKYKGAKKVRLNKGQLEISTSLGKLSEHIPESYYLDKQQNLKVEYRELKANQFGFQLPDYDKSKTLIIDPAPHLEWATYYGGSSSDVGFAVEVDSSGNVFWAGQTYSSNLATSGAYQTSWSGNSDVLLSKFDPAGNLIWATYYGGSSYEVAYGLGIEQGDLYISGVATDNSFMATPGAFQSTFSSGQAAFFAKFDTSGQRIWSSYFGGLSGYEAATCLTTDGNGKIYFAGSSGSDGLATAGTEQTTNAGSYDAFVAVFDTAGQRLWSTYIGGGAADHAQDITVAPNNGDIYITGETESSTGIATPGAHDPTYAPGSAAQNWNAYLVKLNSNGIRQWGTYYGDAQTDYGSAVDLDSSSNVYLLGTTYNSTLSTLNSYQAEFGGGVDAYLAKFNATGQRQWASYYGGTNIDSGEDLYISADAVYISGWTSSDGNIASLAAPQNMLAVGDDAYLARFTLDGQRIWGTYHGGNDVDRCWGMAYDPANDLIYLTGSTESSSGFASVGAQQTVYNGGGGFFGDGFLIKYSNCDLVASPSPTTVVCPYDSTGAISVLAQAGIPPYSYQWSTGSTASSVSDLPAGIYYISVTDQNNCEAIETVEILANSNIETDFSYQGTGCDGSSIGSAQVLATGGFGSYSYLWSNGSTTSSVSNLGAGNYTVTVVDGNNCLHSDNVSIGTADLIIDAQMTMVSCVDSSDGQILLACSGGYGPYTFFWADGFTTDTRTGLAAGNYTVTATDATGCTEITLLEITEPAPLTISFVNVIDASCETCDNGLISVSLLGGGSNISFQWSTGETNNGILFGLLPGIYGVTISDGCTEVDTTVTVEPFLSPTNEIVRRQKLPNISPNPASNKLQLKNIPMGAVVYLYDYNGRAILRRQTSSHQAVLDIENLPQGAYLLHLIWADGQWTERFVKKE